MDPKVLPQELIQAWHERSQRGESVSLEELCAGSPTNLEALKKHLEAVASMQEFLQLSVGRTAELSAGSPDADTLNRRAGQTLRGGAAPLQVIAGYELLEELERGGMGIVYKARQTSLKRLVALKMILHASHADSSQLARFRAEAEAVAMLHHPNIVQVFEIGVHEGSPYFSMEYVEGNSLAHHLAKQLLNADEAAALLVEIAGAVQFAHENGVIHRDLKPANILMQGGDAGSRTSKPSSKPSKTTAAAEPAAGTPKVTDFGLAKQIDRDSGLTRTGAIMGTPSYMAPEQASGRLEEIGPATDVYALGAILYESLTGRPPFRGPTMLDTLREVRDHEPIPPSRLQGNVPRDLEVICLKCLRKEPAKRYASAKELADDLRRFRAGEPILARRTGMAERLVRWCRRNKLVAGLLATVFVAVAAGMAGIVHFGVEANESAAQAIAARDKAKDAAAKETAEREKAQDSAARLHESQIRQSVATGRSLHDAGKLSASLSWYARAWQLDGDNDPARTRNHRMRLALTLNEGPRLVGACFHDQPVLDAQFGRDAKTILTRTDGPLVRLWDPFTSKPAAPPLAHDGTVHAAMFSPDLSKVVTGSADGHLRFWDAGSGKLLHQLKQDSAVVAAACDPLGQTVAAASKTGVVQFWSLLTGEPVGRSLLLPAPAYHVAFSPDGTRLLTADVKDMARVWSVATGEAAGRAMPHTDQRFHSEHAIEIRCWPTFSPDGATVAAVTNRKGTSATEVALWDLEKGAPRFPAIKLGYFVYQVRFNPNGSRFTTANGDVTQVRESATGREQAFLKHPRESPHGAFNRDATRMATCSTSGVVHVWDIAPGKNKEKEARQVHEPLRCADGVHALQFSNDSRFLLVASHDGTARVWELQPGAPATPYQHDCGRGHLELARTGVGFEAFSPDGQRKLLFRRAAPPVLSDANQANTTPLEAAQTLVLARFSADGKQLVGLDSQRTLRSWNAATGKRRGEAVVCPLTIEHLELSRDGARILTVERAAGDESAKRVVTVWNADTGKAVFGPLDEWDSGPQIFDRQEFLGRFTRAALSPDGDRLATGSNASGVLAVWDLKSKAETARRRVFHGNLQVLRFSDDGAQLVTCGSDTCARVLHAADLQPACPSLLHPVFCRDADLDPSGASVVTVDSKGTVRLWDSRSGDLLGQLNLSLAANRARFSGDGGRVVFSDGQQLFELPRFHAGSGSLPPLLRLLTGQEIDGDGNVRPVEGRVFLDQPAIHRDAWLAWRGVK